MAWGTDNELLDSQFFNRTEELDLIGNLLNSSRYGSTPTLFLTGVRGVGKTAIIKRIKHEFQNDFLIVHIDLSKSDAYQKTILDRPAIINLFFDRLMEECSKKGLKTLTKKIKKIFKTNNFTIDKIINYGNVPIPIPKAEEDYTKLANFVINLPQLIYEEYKDEVQGVFVFIDEFQLLKELNQQLDSFLWFLRSNIQDQKNVAYILSGSMSLKDEFIAKVAGNNGAFGGRILSIEIKPFTYETTINYLQSNAGELNFTEDGYKRFYKCTRGIPFYINTFAKILPINEELDDEKVKLEFKKGLSILAIHYINVWYSLTRQEQEIIIKLIEEPLMRKELAEELGVTTGSISLQLNKLKDLMLIELDNGKYKIYDPVLALWLKDYYRENGVYPYRML